MITKHFNKLALHHLSEARRVEGLFVLCFLCFFFIMSRSRTFTLTLSACFRQKQFSNNLLLSTRTRTRSCSSSSTMPPFSYCRPQPTRAHSDQCFVDDAMASPRGRTRVCFAVHVENILPNEFVMVAGSCEELGKWDPQSAIILTQDAENTTRWLGHVMTNDQSLSFRYFVAYKLCGDQGERLIISRWESFLHPRSVLVPAEQRNGVCRSTQVDLFGYYAGQRLLSDGWLQHSDEYQILLRIHGKALKFFKTSKDRNNCRIRITPLDVRKKHELVKGISILKNNEEAESCVVDEEDDEDDTATGVSLYPSHSSTDIAVLSDVSPRFRKQPSTGVVFNNNKDYLVFKTHSVAVDFLAFYVEVFSEEQKRIGACYALPASLSDSFGATQLPFINSNGRPIGQISIEYLFVRSLQKTVPFQTMEKSFSRYWKKRTTLEVGHRGAGSSYTKLAMTRENTVQSLNTAAKNGADFVEFDVQLTKDKVAVIYHDFHVLVSVAKRGVNSSSRTEEGVDYHEIAIKDLKLNQLKLLMLDHLSILQKKSKLCENNEEDDMKPFPTLVEALNKVDKDVGFNVEVKYPMMQTNGEHECDHYFERNEFVDIILADILNRANGRRIMFSSFDPDICSLIAIKQNKYPVLFLCVGETTRYTPFSDQRTSTSLTAVNFAAGADILGVNFHSEDLLKDPYPVQRASEFGLVSFVWGDDLDTKETLNYFKRELGVDGLIYDRIGEEEGRRNVFLVEREQKRAIFLASSGQSTPRAPSPVDSVSSTSSNFSEAVSPKRTDIPQLDLEINKINIHNQSPRVQITQS